MRPRSLRAQLLLGTILVIVLVMTAVMVVADHRQRGGIVDEVERRGEALARSLAAISYGPLLLYNFTALEQNVVRMAAEHDVVYAVVLDADGKVAAHSRYPERVGLLLQGVVHERAASAVEPLTQETVTSGARPCTTSPFPFSWTAGSGAPCGSASPSGGWRTRSGGRDSSWAG